LYVGLDRTAPDTLSFAETIFSFTAAGVRLFDVSAEGKLIEDIDIFQQAGGQAFRAITREIAVTVLDGVLSLQFVPVVEFAKVS
jgi:Malectin domain